MPEEKKRVGVGCGVLVLQNNHVLLGLRASDPNTADSELHGEGTWTPPGGKIEYGEDLFACAKRELAEETTMILLKGKIICVNTDKNEHAHFVTIGFLAEDYHGEPKVTEPLEITEWKWFPLDKLPTKVFEPGRKMIECYKQSLFTLEN